MTTHDHGNCAACDEMEEQVRVLREALEERTAAVAEERERCAWIAENPDRYRMYWRVERPLGPAIAAAIRAEP